MEIWDVIGVRKVSFKDQKTDQQVEGFTLYLQRVPVDKDIDGMECAKQFISSRYVDYTPVVGDRIQLVYNRYGKIGSIQTC